MLTCYRSSKIHGHTSDKSPLLASEQVSGGKGNPPDYLIHLPEKMPESVMEVADADGRGARRVMPGGEWGAKPLHPVTEPWLQPKNLPKPERVFLIEPKTLSPEKKEKVKDSRADFRLN
mgnify:CR=1 FL=1